MVKEIKPVVIKHVEKLHLHLTVNKYIKVEETVQHYVDWTSTTTLKISTE
jgi:hypothetical protein